MTRVLTRHSLRETLSTALTSFELPTSPPTLEAVPIQQLRRSVLAFGSFVAVLVILAAYFTDRNGDMDELTFYNPSYMISHFGKWTYPGYAHRTYFEDPVITHPPLHVGLIGLLGRLGFTYYYAEATPTVFFFLLSIFLILRGRFPAPVQLGLLFSIGFLMLTGETFALSFGTRPEGELHAAWFCGLLLLESGRLEDWNLPKLFAGAFLLTWASGLHYYAAAAFLGVSVYMVWALVSLGWKNGWPRVAALCAGGCLFGIPYMAFYLAPYFKKIWMAVQANQGNQGVMVALRTQFDWYRKWSQLDYIPALLRKPFGWGIPLLVYSTAILASIRSTRGLALAALPLQLFLFAFASHKLSSYFIHEVGIFAAAVAVGLIVLADYLLRRFEQTRLQNFLLPAAASLMVAYLIAANPALRAATVAEQANVHEADIARAASRSILGPHAKVAGRLGAWYSSGGEYWWDIESDMLRADPMNPATYFSNFDAVAEYTHMSDATQNSSISSWYANGALKLRGFFFGETNEQLQIVLLTARSAPHVIGYAARNHQLFRFEEQTDGDYETLSAVCPMTPELQQDHWGNRWDGTFSSMLRLPVRNSEPASVVLTVVAPRMLAEPAGWMARSCRSVGKVPGTLLLADRDWLIASLRHDDLPMKFPRDMESLPGYTGQGLNSAMTPPTESVRSNQFLSLAAIQPTTPQALVARVPQIRITTPAAGGSFAAQIPIAGRQSAPGPCWVQLRLRVLSGRIGFATYNIRDGILERTSAPVSKSAQPMDVVLSVSDLRKATSVVIFNDGDTAANVDVLDATVLTASSAGHQ